MAAERKPITAVEEAALEARRQVSSISDAERAQFRKERWDWATSGCLPTDKVRTSFDDIVARLTPEDIPFIEEEVQRKMTALLVKVTAGTVDADEMNTFFSRVFTLHAKQLISDDVYAQTQLLFDKMTPPVSAHQGG